MMMHSKGCLLSHMLSSDDQTKLVASQLLLSIMRLAGRRSRVGLMGGGWACGRVYQRRACWMACCNTHVPRFDWHTTSGRQHQKRYRRHRLASPAQAVWSGLAHSLDAVLLAMFDFVCGLLYHHGRTGCPFSRAVMLRLFCLQHVSLCCVGMATILHPCCSCARSLSPLCTLSARVCMILLLGLPLCASCSQAVSILSFCLHVHHNHQLLTPLLASFHTLC